MYRYRLTSLLILVLLLHGCASAPKSALTPHIKKANRGSITDMEIVASGVCQKGMKNYKVVPIDFGQCAYWVERWVDYNDARGDKNAPIFYMHSAVTGLHKGYNDPDVRLLIEQIHEQILAADLPQSKQLLISYIIENPGRINNGEQLKLRLAKQQCYKSQRNCHFLGSTYYAMGDLDNAKKYYSKQDSNPYKSHLQPFYLNLVKLYMDTAGEFYPHYAKPPVEQFELSHRHATGSCSNKYPGHYSYSKQLCNGVKNTDLDAMKAQLQHDVQFMQSASMSREERVSRYKQELVASLKGKDYASAIRHFASLDKLQVTLPASMVFFKAEALDKQGQKQNAYQVYRQYIDQVGVNGNFSDKALEAMVKIEESK